jgi:hypothetical protein
MDQVEERMKAVVASLLAKIDTKDAEIARSSTALDNFKQLVLEHQEEGESLYRKIQDQEKTILGLLKKVKLNQGVHLSEHQLSAESTLSQELGHVKEKLVSKETLIKKLTDELKVIRYEQAASPASLSCQPSLPSIPPPPVLFIRPPRYRQSLADVKLSLSANFIESLVDEMIGNSDEMLNQKIDEQHEHLLRLESVLDVAEVELRHWREVTKDLIEPLVDQTSDGDHD